MYKILPPHITLAFPFESSMSNEELKDRLMQALKSVKPFEIVMSGVSLHKDENIKTNYIFLNVVSGVKKIKILHNEIYEKVLGERLVEDLRQYNYGLPLILPIVIEKLWGERINLSFEEENILRSAYNDLKSPGYFQFEE